MTTRKVINIGSAPNDFTGDSIRAAMGKVNDNFSALWDEKSEVIDRFTDQIDAILLLTQDDSGTTYANTDTAAVIDATLPDDPETGTAFTFLVTNALGWNINAPAGVRIRVGTALSNAAGYVEGLDLGSAVTLVYVGNALWFAKSYIGTWTPY
jgi:hypothetical protein